MRRFAVLVAFLVSGCLGGADEAAPTMSNVVGPHTPQFDAETGALVVQVLSAELQPVPDALVVLNETQASARTNELGEAAFDNLAPGAYTLFVAAYAHHPAERAVEVVAGEATRLSVILQAASTPLPYSEVLTYTGLWRCWITVGTVNVAEPCYYVSGQTTSSFLFPVGSGWTSLVLEATTTPTWSYGAKGFGWGLHRNQTGQSCHFRGFHTSPLYFETHLGTTYGCGSTKPGPMPDGPLWLRWDQFPWTGNQTTDVVVANDQRFTDYVSVFYLEPHPSGYSALPDA